MAKRGRAKAALATAAIGSFVAGTISIVLLTFVARPVADLAVKFQPADYFWLTVLAFASVTAVSGVSECASAINASRVAGSSMFAWGEDVGAFLVR